MGAFSCQPHQPIMTTEHSQDWKCLTFPEGGKPDSLENPCGTAENQRTTQLTWPWPGIEPGSPGWESSALRTSQPCHPHIWTYLCSIPMPWMWSIADKIWKRYQTTSCKENNKTSWITSVSDPQLRKTSTLVPSNVHLSSFSSTLQLQILQYKILALWH